jgi:hypothetical protein
VIRAGLGVYLLLVTSRFGTLWPSVEQAVEAIAAQRGEVIVPSGAAAANSLGVTTQVPVQSVYLTPDQAEPRSIGGGRAQRLNAQSLASGAGTD